MVVNTPRAILDFGDLPPPGFGISAFNLFHFRVKLAQTVALPTSPRYICMNNTIFSHELTLLIFFFFRKHKL